MRNHPGEMHGTLQEGKTEFIARVGDEIIVVRDVPISHLRPVRRGILQRGSFPKDRCRDERCPQRQALLPAPRPARSNSPGEAGWLGPGTSPLRPDAQCSAFSAYNPYGQAFSLDILALREDYQDDLEKTTRLRSYETNRDVKWICRTLQRMEAQDEDFESGSGRWRAGARRRPAKRRGFRSAPAATGSGRRGSRSGWRRVATRVVGRFWRMLSRSRRERRLYRGVICDRLQLRRGRKGCRDS